MYRQIMQVRAFQQAFDAPLPGKPTMLDEKRAKLRHKLLQEEVREINKAEDLVGVADGICDAMYILLGTALEYGIGDRLEMLFDEVHKSNMTKMGPDGKPIYRKDGKVMKPKSFKPPKLELILERDFTQYLESDILREIQKEERIKWLQKIDGIVYKKLKWHHRLLSKIADWCNRIVDKKVDIKLDVDENYRNTAKIKVYNFVMKITDH